MAVVSPLAVNITARIDLRITATGTPTSTRRVEFLAAVARVLRIPLHIKVGEPRIEVRR